MLLLLLLLLLLFVSPPLVLLSADGTGTKSSWHKCTVSSNFFLQRMLSVAQVSFTTHTWDKSSKVYPKYSANVYLQDFLFSFTRLDTMMWVVVFINDGGGMTRFLPLTWVPLMGCSHSRIPPALHNLSLIISRCFVRQQAEKTK